LTSRTKRTGSRSHSAPPDAAVLETALENLLGTGETEVLEDSRLLGGFAGLRYELHSRGGQILLHLWSEEFNLVRRILSIAETAAEKLVLDVERFGRGPGTLALVRPGAPGRERRWTREKFRRRFEQMLAEQFPDERPESLTSAPDLEHSLSGSYVRGWQVRGQQAWAVLGAAPGESATTFDGILTFGLLWLHWAREHAARRVVQGLRLFLSEGSSRITAHRFQALADWVRAELYEFSADTWQVQQVDPNDRGNLATWLTPRREVEQTLAAALESVEKIRGLAPEAISVVVPPGTKDVALRFRGLEFARWRGGKVFFGVSDQRRELTVRNWGTLRKLVERLAARRHPMAADRNDPLYRAQPERWLEHVVQANPARLDAQLDPGALYAQVPAFSAGDRGVIDLLGVTRQGRLAVVELKASEDLHLALQAVDYWLRVRWHHQQDEFPRYGYFTGRELQKQPPLLYLVAPGLRFHPATDVILRHLSPEVEIVRLGLNENWRQNLEVVFRQ